MTEAVASSQLVSFVQRIERVEEEKKAASDDLKVIYEEAKGNGFDTRVLRDIIRLRRMDDHRRRAHRSLLDLYLAALGMGDQAELISGDEETAAEVTAADAAEKKKRGRRAKPESPSGSSSADRSEGGADILTFRPPDGSA